MTSIKRPIWIEMVNNPYNIINQRTWPFLEAETIDLTKVEYFVKSFFSGNVSNFSGRISDLDSSIHLIYLPELEKYRGIIIPANFPTLDNLIKIIFNIWTGDDLLFEDWIKSFFNLRLEKGYLRYYQNDNEYNLRLPPLFILTPQQIQSPLLISLRQNIDNIENLTEEIIANVIEKNIPVQYLQTIIDTPSELKLTKIHLLNTYLHTLEMINFSEFMYLKNLLNNLSHFGTELVLFSYLQIRASQEKEIDDKLIEFLEQDLEYRSGMLKILQLRILIQYYKNQSFIDKQERYNQLLIKLAPSLSWTKNLDLINAQIGLASCSLGKGDYFRSMTFYSFARQGLSNLGIDSLRDKMEEEYQKISVLSGSQQIQSALYQINHNNYDRSILLLLVDGVQNVLTHYLRYNEVKIEIELILSPLLLSATQVMLINQSKFSSLFVDDVDFSRLVTLAKHLTNHKNRQILRLELQNTIELLSYKDHKMIERISVFFDDGRHIGDYHMKNGKFEPIKQNPNQSLFSSAMSAVSMLLTEATESDQDVDEISIGNKKVIYDSSSKLTFCLICNSSNSNLKQLLRNVVNTIETKYKTIIENWNGNLNSFSELVELLAPLSFYAIEQDHQS